MKAITSNRAAWTAFASLAFYWVLAAIVPTPILREVFNSLSLGVALMVVITWFPATARAFRHGAGGGEGQLVIAIFLAFAVLTFQRVYVIVLNTMANPQWLRDSSISGFVPYLITIVGILFLIAPGVQAGAPRGRHWWHIIIGVALGSGLAGVMLGRSF